MERYRFGTTGRTVVPTDKFVYNVYIYFSAHGIYREIYDCNYASPMFHGSTLNSFIFKHNGKYYKSITLIGAPRAWLELNKYTKIDD